MKKRILSSLVLACWAAALLAVPAKRVTRTITLADGSTRVVTLCGDENMHFYQAADGTVYRKGADGLFYEKDVQEVKAEWKSKVQRRNAPRLATWGAERQNVRGQKKGLVILVNFKDKAMTVSQTEYYNFFNQAGYNKDGMAGSVRDYFLSQSYGLLDIEFDVVGPVTVSKNLAYYGEDDSEGDDKHPAEMVIEALRLADSQVNFSKYDWDSDGEVDQVYVIYAGYGEAHGAATSTIWPHEWDLNSARSGGDGSGSLRLDGVTLNTYACSCELQGTSGSKMDGVGTACHEFSHCLGIPDFYDTSGNDAFGMAHWSLMDYGCYGGAGYVPCGYTSYERMYSGWLNPTELTSYTQVTEMPALTSDSVAYVIYNQANRHEYYLLENRQQTGWDAELPGHGLLVLHVDFDSNAWLENSVNANASHQRVTIVPADGVRSNKSLAELAGDPWPGTSKKTALINPTATLYNANSDGTKYLNFPIRKIAEDPQKGTVSFVAGNLTIVPPVATAATDVTPAGFTANWETVEGAESYEVVLSAKDPSNSKEEVAHLDEDFSGFNNSKGTDGTVDISKETDNYTHIKGWSGTKLYTSGSDAVKLGSSKAVGSITTPMMAAPESGSVTISVSTRKYGSDTGSLTVKLNGTLIGEITPAAQESTQNFTVDCTEAFSLTLATTSKRAYLYGLTVVEPSTGITKTSVSTGETSHTFTGLDQNLAYSYVVYAVQAGERSDKSNNVEVSLDTGTSVADPLGEEVRKDIIYDLMGRRVSATLKGIYIVNGQKVIR